MDVADLSVIACPAPLRPAALRKLHDGLPQDQQAALVEALKRIGHGDGAHWDGLLVSTTSPNGGAAELVGAVWVQQLPGNTAVVWPPAPNGAVADSLLRASAQWCDERAIPLAQLSPADEHSFPPDRLEACGYSWLADLKFLYAEVVPKPGAPEKSPNDVRLVAGAGDQPLRLAALIEKTYDGTQDCPALDGLRATSDVLAGYGAQGRYIADHWYIVQSDGADVGVLLLAAHPAAGNCELVYMGVVPAARGRGVGAQIVQAAFAGAAAIGANRLVLAVDAANRPALALYQRAGFVEWGQRTVYARCRQPSA